VGGTERTSFAVSVSRSAKEHVASPALIRPYKRANFSVCLTKFPIPIGNNEWVQACFDIVGGLPQEGKRQ
jgi:hypothetical protein